MQCLQTSCPPLLRRKAWGRAVTQETDCWEGVAAVLAERGWSAPGCQAAVQRWWGSLDVQEAWLPEALGEWAVNPADQLECLRQKRRASNLPPTLLST